MKIRRNNIVYPPKKSVYIPIVNLSTDCYISQKGKVSKPSPPELRIAKVLKEQRIKFIEECSFKNFGHPFSPYRFDFYLPEYKVVVEYDGSHHSQRKIKFNDKLKNKFCRINKIQIVRFNKKHYFELESHIRNLCKGLKRFNK